MNLSGDDRETYSRRKILKTGGTALALGLAGCSDLGESKPTTTTPDPLKQKYPEADTPTQLEAAKHVEENYPDHSETFNSFISDPELDTAFTDEQLSLWMTGNSRWQEAILALEDGLFQDDWTRNGRPHLLPDGSEGPAYNKPFTLTSAFDAWMTGYYNSTGKEYDVRTGNHIGFQPEQTFGPHGNLQDFGDKAGLKGDMNGNGSVAEHIEGIEPEDLDPQEMHTVMAYNWMKEAPEGVNDHHEGNHKPTDKAFNMMKNMLENKVPEPVFREVMENNGRPGDQNIPAKVNFHTINLGPIPFDDSTHPGPEATSHYRENMPKELRGPATYAVYIHYLERAAGLGIVTESDDKPDEYPDIGNAGAVSYAPLPKSVASTTSEETYWHGVARGVTEPNNKSTLTSEVGSSELDFLDKEWKKVIRGMNPQSRSHNYYRTAISELEDRE